MINITIAIPTFNRAARLATLINSIDDLIVPSKVNLRVAISNSGSFDETPIFLDLLKNFNPKFYYIHNKLSSTANWYSLMKIVPKDTDFVWLIGDDDEILNRNAIVHIINIINKKGVDIDAIFLPMKKRSKSNSLHLDKLSNLCNSYGFHEVLGWISSHFIRYRYYLEIFELYGNILQYRASPPQDVYKNRVGLFLHATQTYKVLFDRNVALLFSDLIDEQVYKRNLKSIIESSRYKKKKFYSGRFFYDIEELNKINITNDFQPSRIFYRYVSRDFILLLFQITYEGSKSREFRRIETLDQLNIIRLAVRQFEDTDFKAICHIIDSLLLSILRLRSGVNFLRKNDASYFKYARYSEFIDENTCKSISSISLSSLSETIKIKKNI